MNNAQVAHVWAQQNKTSGKGSNFFFETDSIYSYGHHFKIAQFVTNSQGQRAILFTNRTYSNSTSKHIGYVRQAIYNLGIPVFYLDQVDRIYLNTPNFHKPILQDYTDRAVGHQQKSIRARSFKTYHINAAINTLKEAEDFAEFFGVEYNQPDMGDLVAEAEAARIAEAAREKAQKAAQRIKDQEQADAWFTGVAYSMPYSFDTDEDGSAYLRIMGENIETSRHASVPLDMAIRLFRFIKKVRASGKHFIANGHRINIGHFSVRNINANGDIQVGCHFITWKRIEEFATKHGYMDLAPVELSEVEEKAVA